MQSLTPTETQKQRQHAVTDTSMQGASSQSRQGGREGGRGEWASQGRRTLNQQPSNGHPGKTSQTASERYFSVPRFVHGTHATIHHETPTDPHPIPTGFHPSPGPYKPQPVSIAANTGRPYTKQIVVANTNIDAPGAGPPAVPCT